jgi:hypothetical protein
VDEHERAALADWERIAPQPQRVPRTIAPHVIGFRGSRGHVRPDPGHADHERVERLVDVDAAELDRSNERLRRARSTAPGEHAVVTRARVLLAQESRRSAPGGASTGANGGRRRDGRAMRGVRVVAETAGQPRMVEARRDAEQTARAP